jgi:hypothetical protein
MALYRLEVQGIQRAQGRSVVAAAAYRAGAALYDQRLEMAFDYTARGGIEHTEIVAPEGAPVALLERHGLWNAAELADKRSDSRPAREILLALPHELNAEQRLALVRAFVAEHVVAHGMIADIALHSPDKAGDQRNHHAHILVTTREVNDEGFGRKVEAWTKPELVRHWRAGWARVQNEHLQKALGREAPQVTDKSLADQGVERDPTIHLGPSASGMERRGERSDRGDVNRAIRDGAAERQALERDLGQTEDEVVAKAPKAARGVQALADEFAALHRDLLREHARLGQARESIVVSGAIGPRTVSAEVLQPARREQALAKTRLERVEARVGAVRTQRNSLVRWIRNPARMIWAKHAELTAIAEAKAAYRLSSARLAARQAWLRSEAGQTYIAKRLEPTQAAYREKRTLERRMKRIAKRAEAVENVRVKALIARELGHRTFEVPSKTVGTTQFVRAMDAATLSAIRQHAPDAQRRAYAKVKAQQRTRPRGPAPEL